MGKANRDQKKNELRMQHQQHGIKKSSIMLKACSSLFIPKEHEYAEVDNGDLLFVEHIDAKT